MIGCNSAQSKADQQGERAYPKHIHATADYDVEGQDKGSAWDAWESHKTTYGSTSTLKSGMKMSKKATKVSSEETTVSD